MGSLVEGGRYEAGRWPASHYRALPSALRWAGMSDAVGVVSAVPAGQTQQRQRGARNQDAWWGSEKKWHPSGVQHHFEIATGGLRCAPTAGYNL